MLSASALDLPAPSASASGSAPLHAGSAPEPLHSALHPALHPAVWRAHQLGRAQQAVLASGFAELDAQLPGGGWPTGALTELLLPHPGVGELRLLAPVLAALQRQQRSLMWLDPPPQPCPWALSALPKALPQGHYHLGDGGLELDATAASLSWELGAYGFDVYKAARREPATLHLASGPAAQRGLLQAAAIASTRDLVNTPAEHMGPAELAEAVRLVARQHGARFKQIRNKQG